MIETTALVIGSGVGGLATAIRLARMGIRVRVFEKNEVPGGKISEIRANGYRFDTGPSLFTLPGLVDELQPGSGRALEYDKLEIISRYFFSDGTVFTAPAEPSLFARELARVTGVSGDRILRYLDDTRLLYEQSSPVFLFSAFHRLSKLFNAQNLGILRAMLRFNPLLSMHAYNQKALRNPQAVQLFDRYATYNGSDPYKAPAMLNMIAHLEHNLGAYFSRGGMYQIVERLVQWALQLGVEFRYNQEVESILIREGKATGIITGGKEYPADLVISAGDIFRTWSRLLPGERTPRRIKKPRLSTSAMIFYLGVRKRFEQLDVHNIFFSGNYREEFRALSPRKAAVMYPDPTVYVYNSSHLEPGDAPPGCSNLFVMINTPYDRGEDWEHLAIQARKNILKKLLAHGIGLEQVIEFEQVATPKSIDHTTLSTAGALYGNHSNSALSAFNRHPNFSRRFPNLFFAGGSVHPGGGIPLCLASAKIVEDEVKSYLESVS